MPARKSPQLPPFDKYYYYTAAVQSPTEDAKFLDSVYREHRGKQAKIFREDFCGTFANCCAWVQMGMDRQAHGIDLDSEPLEYGSEHYLSALPAQAQKRIKLHRRTVMSPSLPGCDIICAMNFSYYIFKQRDELKRYFKNCVKTLNKGGVMVMDCFGGPKCMEANEEVSEHGTKAHRFDYYWDQDSFDPLTNEAQFSIHFKRPGEKKRTKVFSYDWRMWAPMEIKDLLMEAGFADVKFYWEGNTKDGFGDGDFKVSDKGEECEAYVTYIAALK